MKRLARSEKPKRVKPREKKAGDRRLARAWARTGLDNYMSPATALCYLITFIWLGIIFMFGGQSGEVSGTLSLNVTNFIQKLLPFLKLDTEATHVIIRKLAHGGVFCVLALFSMFAVGGTVKRKLKAILLVTAFCILTSAANEIEQLFVEGRGASGLDVLIDMTGAIIGMWIACMFLYILPARKRRRAASAARSQVFDKETQWLCLPEFAQGEPIDVWASPELAKAEDAPKNVHMYARRVFRLGKRITDAKLKVTADDMYKLYVNGKYVCQGPAPGYPGNYYVNEIELKPYLCAGENVLALHVYYQGLINRVWVSGDRRQGFKLELRVNGKLKFRSDGNFRCLEARAWQPLAKAGYDTQFIEAFDGRLEPAGWKRAGFDDTDWKDGAIRRKADYTFTMQPTPVLDTREAEPASVSEDAGRYVCDFGAEISGVLLLRAEGPGGAQVRVRTGEELDEDGNVRWNARCNCAYDELWTLMGDSDEYEGYDYRGFRYAELIADEGARITSVRARAQGYPLNADACTLETDDRALTRVFELCKNTIREGVQEGYIDCPTREKGQYAGDLYVTALAHAYVSGDTRLMKKALDDWMRSGDLPGGPYSVFPCAHKQKIADYALLFPSAALRLYEHTGDAEYLKSTYQASQAVLSVYRIYERADGLIEHVTEGWNLVDWPQNLRDDYDFKLEHPIGPGCHNVINAFYLDAVSATERMAKILGEECKPRFPLLCRAFDACFYRADTGLYADAEGSNHSAQHSNILPLSLGICRKERMDKIADFLIEGGIRTGVYMSYFYLKALAAAQKYDALYAAITQNTAHSWIHMLDEGATTLFEAWGKTDKWNTSLCHPWACAPLIVIVEDILGITPDTASGTPWKARLPDKLGALRARVPVCGKVATVERDDALTTLTMEWKG